MDKTPNNRLQKISCKKLREPTEDDTIIISHLNANSCSTSTPVKTSAIESENDDTFSLSGCTQDYNDDVVVTWDWNSPQQTHKEKRKKRILASRLSPKVTIRRHPSNNNQQQMFEKLKEEFLELRRQIALPDNEISLNLSPQEEVHFKDDGANDSALDSLVTTETFNAEQDFEDIFNDSLDEQLVLCSQQVENVLLSNGVCDKKVMNVENNTKDLFSLESSHINNLPSSSTAPINNNNLHNGVECNTKDNLSALHSSKVKCFKSLPNSSVNHVTNNNVHRIGESLLSLPTKHNFNSNHHNNKYLQCKNEISEKLDDSFDVIFEAVQDKDIELLSQTPKETGKYTISKSSSPSIIKRTYSDIQVNSRVSEQENKTEFIRTQSFESSEMARREVVISPGTLREIERKRQEALARLESKRKKAASTSPFQCSPDEIEQKRLQAVEKLARKQQQEIERKRQEALKKLELNKMKRSASLVGNTKRRL